MPPRVTYWTGTWDPTKEGISKEIGDLRQGPRARAPVVAFSPANRTHWKRQERVLLLSDRRWLALRLIARAVEPTGHVTHVFGGRSSWHLVRSLGRRPIVLTAVAMGDAHLRLPKVPLARVVVETDGALREWLSEGLPRERIVVVRPGVDLERYRAMPEPASTRPTLLFASTPSDPDELEPRGVPLLVELARHRPDLDILLPWRQWGVVDEANRRLDQMNPPPNFIVEHGDVPDMRSYLVRAHATILCFAQGAGKACPNFVVEGLASGRPTVTTAGTGIDELIAREGAGVVAPAREVVALSAAVDRMLAGREAMADRARHLATSSFDARRFRAQYERLYEEVATEHADRPA